jgi:hypothetical protein
VVIGLMIEAEENTEARRFSLEDLTLTHYEAFGFEPPDPNALAG